ncbi:MAG TPA: YMGG-like glycine zipper-containing protein [Terriglobia bacterium]|nr:YMGG-like glycine zipper-containing protein [Terriglobia bacterium]
MKKLGRLMMAVTVMAIVAIAAFADTLVLTDGTRISGYFEGGSARVVKFRGNDGAIKDYDILKVQQVFFESAPVPLTPPAAAAAAPVAVPPPAGNPAPAANTASTNTTPPAAASDTSSTPQLRPASERLPTHPTSSTAANTGYSVPTGSKLIIQLVDAINSETSKAGSAFVAILDEPLLVDGIEVAPRGADVRGRITTANDAGRIAGAAELGLELTQIYINGIPYALSTSEYSEAGKSRTGQTVQRAGIGAGVGAIIGAIAGGGKGAAIGAGVGAGAGTASQVLTKGEKLNIPAETKLEFTLRTPLVIAAR